MMPYSLQDGDIRPISSRQSGRTWASRTPVGVNTSVLTRLPQDATRIELDALVRRSLPIPHLRDERTDPALFTKRSPQVWEQQVIKAVPRRPNYVLTSYPGTADLAGWELNDDFIKDTKSVFYFSKKKETEKCFSIDPEWASEKVHLKGGPRSYRTNPIRFGWCS